jgi:hypothetical protein
MTDSGLFSGVYQDIRDHADLLDRVLVRLKAGTSATTDDERRQLSAWLTALAAGGADDPTATTIRVLLRGQGAATQQRAWAEAGESLRAGGVSPDVIDRLERLAQALDQEQAAGLARLRGEA